MEIHESRKRMKQIRDYADNLEAELAQARTAIQNLNSELDNAKQFAQKDAEFGIESGCIESECVRK